MIKSNHLAVCFIPISLISSVLYAYILKSNIVCNLIYSLANINIFVLAAGANQKFPNAQMIRICRSRLEIGEALLENTQPISDFQLTCNFDSFDERLNLKIELCGESWRVNNSVK